MKNESLALLALASLIILAGCSGQQATEKQDITAEQAQRLATGSPFPPVYDPNAVCPFECCKNEERYYDKRCTGRAECISGKCVAPKEAPKEKPVQLKLADNEVYPGVFIEILGAKQITQRIKEPEERYGLVGQYVMDAKRDGVVYGYEEGKKLVIVEMTVENRALDAEYSRENFNSAGLQFYVANSDAEKHHETLAPPQDHDPITVYYSDIPVLNRGEKKEVFIAFLVPVDFAYKKLIMSQDDELFGFGEEPVVIDRDIEYTI